MYKKIIVIVVLCLSMVFPFLLHAQSSGTYDRGMYIAKGDTLPYRILFPENFDPQKKYPLLLVLHGAGERGNDNEAELAHGGDLFLKSEVRQQFPAIVVFPQCPKASFWSNVQMQNDTGKYKFVFLTKGKPTKAMHALLGLTNELLDKPYVDKHKVYVGGLSMGGMGTFEIIRRKPKLFAAAFAICGGDNTLNAKKYAKKVPLWIFHGAKDDIVSPDHSEVVVAAIKEAGGDPKYTVYPNDGHNSWDSAFAEPELLPWLFSHEKK